jgi:hypothetical protein
MGMETEPQIENRRRIPTVAREDFIRLAEAVQWPLLATQREDRTQSTPFSLTFEIDGAMVGWVEDYNLPFAYLAFRGPVDDELLEPIMKGARCLTDDQTFEMSRDAESRRRATGILALAVSAPRMDDRFVTRVADALRDPEPNVRAAALVAIRYMADFPREFVEAVADEDPLPAVRGEARAWLQRQ